MDDSSRPAASAGSSIEHGSGGHQTCNFSFEGSRDSNLLEMSLNTIEKTSRWIIDTKLCFKGEKKTRKIQNVDKFYMMVLKCRCGETLPAVMNRFIKEIRGTHTCLSTLSMPVQFWTFRPLFLWF